MHNLVWQESPCNHLRRMLNEVKPMKTGEEDSTWLMRPSATQMPSTRKIVTNSLLWRLKSTKKLMIQLGGPNRRLKRPNKRSTNVRIWSMRTPRSYKGLWQRSIKPTHNLPQMLSPSLNSSSNRSMSSNISRRTPERLSVNKLTKSRGWGSSEGPRLPPKQRFLFQAISLRLVSQTTLATKFSELWVETKLKNLCTASDTEEKTAITGKTMKSLGLEPLQTT